MGKARQMMERIVWYLMIRLVKLWANRYMDQWDRVKFNTTWGTVYLSITREDPYPDSYDEIK